MSIFKLVRLKFHGDVHFGDHRPNDYNTTESFLHSDTIYAALASLAYQNHLTPLKLTVLSSAFPYVKWSNQDILFFPKPLGVKVECNGDISIKDLKKVQWLDQKLFEDCMSQGYCQAQTVRREYAISFKPDPTFFVSIKKMSQRVKIPRDRGLEDDPDPFYMERLSFNPEGGLFFLARVPEEEKDQFKKLLYLLKYSGIGTDRTVGLGDFSYEITDEWELKFPQPSRFHVSLGLICPTESEASQWFNNLATSFQLIKRGGWITAPPHQTIRKKSIYMLTEGAVLPMADEGFSAGNPNINLKPDDYPTFPIERNGRSLVIPFNHSKS